MDHSYYLGANSRGGFVSLYQYFPGGGDAMLHIVKGGPGTGKSSFMRRLGRAAEERGLDVQYVRCSGDPDSLDGVYIPALRRAWADGTAPHVLEPRHFGVDADYVNLGCFCRTPLGAADAERIRELDRRYKSFYALAYRALCRAESREGGGAPDGEPGALLREAEGEPRPIIGPERRFLRAISCRGVLRLRAEAEKLCPVIRPVSQRALTALSRELERRRLPAIRCPLPLDASLLEAILLPWAGLGFSAEWELSGLEEALEALREAKALHDELEAVYRPHMDFEALTAFTEETVEQLFLS